MGGASAANILLGIVRTKVFAVLLGPGGIGLIGVYTSITHFASVLAGMGINRSGVRQIAGAAGSGDEFRMAATIKALRRVTALLGLMGGLLLAALSIPISQLTFGNRDHWASVAILGTVVFFTAVSGGQEALVQGLRRLGDLVRIKVLGSVWGTVLGIPIVWLWREEGVVWMLVAVSGMGVITSWYYARRVEVSPVTIDWPIAFGEARSLLKFGVALMGAGLVGAATVYLLRLMIIHHAGLDAVGQYFAAYTLSGIYVGFILQAMGADFYPRLTAAAHNNTECNRLVNEQAEIALLLAVPGLVAVLSLAPQVIHIFYSSDFVPSVMVLRWQVLGLLGQVVSWPIGFVLLAKGRGRTFFLAELISNCAHLALMWFLTREFGLVGAGMAFFGAYLFYIFFIYSIVRRISAFAWSPVNRRLACWLVPPVGIVFLSTWFLPGPWAAVFGVVVTVVVSWFSLNSLVSRVGSASVLAHFNKAKKWLGLKSR